MLAAVFWSRMRCMRLPRRRGERPRTSSSNPHEQLEQNAPLELQDTLAARASELSRVRLEPSGVGPRGTRAFVLEDAAGVCTPGCCMVGREFAHLHPPHDGSLHLTLPEPLRALAIKRGWAEPHPLAGKCAPASTVMVYGPRDAEELEVVWRLLRASYDFACR